MQLAGYGFLGSRLLRLGGLRVLWSVEQGRRSLACNTMSLGARVHFSKAAVSEFFSGGKYQLGLALTETVKLIASMASDHRYSFRLLANSET